MDCKAGGAEKGKSLRHTICRMSATKTNPATSTDLAPLSPAELGKIAAVSTSTARRLIQSGRIKSAGIDILGRPLFNLADLEALRAQRWSKVSARFLVAPTSGHRTLD